MGALEPGPEDLAGATEDELSKWVTYADDAVCNRAAELVLDETIVDVPMVRHVLWRAQIIEEIRRR